MEFLGFTNTDHILLKSTDIDNQSDIDLAYYVK